MFDQTFVSGSKSGRKPFSMLLSLMLQILVIGLLCLAPFVFTQVLPSMQMRSVIAAPPKAPTQLRVKTVATRSGMAMARVFHLPSIQLAIRPFNNRARAADMEQAPGVDLGTNVSGVPDGIFGASAGEVTVAPPMPMEKPNPPVRKPMRVGTIASANLIHMVQPAYPPLARSSRVQGVVEFTATISKEGTIENLVLKSGHPLLVSAARDAVLQWRYRPTLLNGEPVEVITDIVVNFTLSQ